MNFFVTQKSKLTGSGQILVRRGGDGVVRRLKATKTKVAFVVGQSFSKRNIV